jgi:hypothetical protein
MRNQVGPGIIGLGIQLLLRLGPSSPGPLVVADNWDGFGARVHAIINARSFAKQTGRPFRFVWPSRADSQEISGQIHFFSDKFIRRYQITTKELDSLTIKSLRQFFRAWLVDLLAPWRKGRRSKTFLRKDDRFDVRVFPGQSRERALAEFASALQADDLAPQVSKLLRTVESTVRDNAVPLCVIHLRFGDLVTVATMRFRSA